MARVRRVRSTLYLDAHVVECSRNTCAAEMEKVLGRRMTEEEKIEFYYKRNLQLKHVEPGDLESVDEMCRDVYFDVGYHNLKLYYETSPSRWSIVTDQNNRIIAVDGLNLLPNGIIYAYIVITIESWRGKGITTPLVPDFRNSPVMASSSADTIKRYAMHGNHWLQKRHGFFGFCERRRAEALRVPSVPGVTIERLRPEWMSRLVEYDEKVALFDRRSFVEEWCSPKDPKHGETVVAIDQKTNACVGYGTLRLFSYYCGIQPLYADDDRVAKALMVALTKWCLREDAYLYMPLMAASRTAIEFCHELGMIITGTEIRNCTSKALDYAKSLPIEKLYAVHEYYPV